MLKSSELLFAWLPASWGEKQPAASASEAARQSFCCSRGNRPKSDVVRMCRLQPLTSPGSYSFPTRWARGMRTLRKRRLYRGGGEGGAGPAARLVRLKRKQGFVSKRPKHCELLFFPPVLRQILDHTLSLIASISPVHVLNINDVKVSMWPFPLCWWYNHRW